MKAIILAAGRGSRLKDLTEDRPKCLNQIGGRTLLEWQLSALRSGGVDEIIIVAGYRSDMLSKYNAKIIYNENWETTNMVRSLMCAENEIKQPVIVSYSDILYSAEVVTSLCLQEKDAVVVYDTNWRELWESRFDNPLEDVESFKINSDGTIQDIGLPVTGLEDVQGQYIGLMLYTPVAYEWIKKLLNKESRDVNKMDMTTLIRGLIQAGHPVYGLAIQGGWCEIDTIYDLELGNQLYSEGLLKLASGSL